MSDIRGYVDQFAPGIASERTIAGVRMNREGIIMVNSRDALVDNWTRQGRVFIANNPDVEIVETMSATDTTIDETDPAVRFTVPSGLCVVPIMVQASVATVIAKSDIFAVVVGDTNSYTSGGDTTLMTARNAIVQASGTQIRTSGVTNLHYSDTAIVEGDVTNPRLLKKLKRQGQASELNTTWNPEFNILKGDPMLYVTGPASFLVYVIQETTAAEAAFTLMWAELDPAVLGL